MRKKFVLLILCLAAVLAAESAFSPISRAEPVKFKAVTFLPVNNEIVSGFKSMVEKINEKFKDDIDIEILGGPEITPPFQLHEAVKSGVVDMGPDILRILSFLALGSPICHVYQ